MKTRAILIMLIMLSVCTAVFAGTIVLPQTGQIKCYDSSGSEIACAGTGQAGEKRYGTSWPNPRFTDNNNGTVTDNLTGLIWLKNANCTETVGGISKGGNGYLTWSDALTWSNNLASGKCGLSDGSMAGDWRLPNILELESLVNEGYNEQTCGSSACSTYAAWLNSQGFANAQSSVYWSSSISACSSSGSGSWGINFEFGFLYSFNRTGSTLIWPVRGGQ